MRQRQTTVVVIPMLLLILLLDRTESGMLRGIIIDLNSKHLEPVEVFRGIPYAGPPVGDNRYRRPTNAPKWNGTKIADNFGPVCPQVLPDITNKKSVLQKMTKLRLDFIEKFQTYLQNQNEDCLTLNIYVAGRSGNLGTATPYPVLVYIHGESFEWGSGNPYDGSVIASYGHVIVITINYRLGVLGFLKTHHQRARTAETDYSCGNFALYDIIAALKWVQNNIAAFNGDPAKVTVFGHDTGAVLVNFLLISKEAKGLFSRTILVSGSALSPWGIAENPDQVRETIGDQTGCLPSNYTFVADIAPCLRRKSLKSLLDIRIESIRFQKHRKIFELFPNIGPITHSTSLIRFVPRLAIILPFDDDNLRGPEYAMNSDTNMFADTDLMLGTNSIESFYDFSELDMKYGFEEDQRNGILRTYIRNTYTYHLNEIFSAVKNEYTDWDKPIQHPFNIRDATMEAISDGHTIAPLLKVALIHARNRSRRRGGANTYFFHFGYQTRNDDNLQRLGAVRGDDIVYLFGMPLVNGEPNFPQNFTKQDIAISENLLHYLVNFIKHGNPNDVQTSSLNHNNLKSASNRFGAKSVRDVVWDPFKISSQLYLNIGTRMRIKNHFRGHKIALWLNLVPQLHQPGDDDVVMSHHHFYERDQLYYSGSVRLETFTRPKLLSQQPQHQPQPQPNPNPNLIECTSNTTNSTSSTLSSTAVDSDDDDILQELTTQEYYGYRTALVLTIGVGSLLLILNVTIFLIIYCQKIRHKRTTKRPPPPPSSTTNVSLDDSITNLENHDLQHHFRSEAIVLKPNVYKKRVQIQDVDVI